MNDERPTHLDLFSGIGGFSLAFEAEGFQTIGFSEIDPYASAVLRKHWPSVPNYGDVRNVSSGLHISPDVITGGFPCQPFGLSGLRRGEADERFLWPECARILREIRPRFALFENVPGILTIDSGRTFNRVLSDISSIGFDCIWNCLPACAVGSPFERDRVWILACSNEIHGKTRMGNFENQTPILNWPGKASEDVWIQAASAAIRMGDGLPVGFYEGRVSCLGNSIVPQVAQIFAKAIYQTLRPSIL